MIHETVVISKEAQLDDSVTIGPYSIIGPDVSIASGTIIESHVVITGRTKIGQDNHIYSFSSIGDHPQDMKYKGEDTELEIGDRNTIREYCTINKGSIQDTGVTRLGNDNWIMAYVHLAHDCQIGNNTIFANNTTLAGHVEVGDYAIFGGFSVWDNKLENPDDTAFTSLAIEPHTDGTYVHDAPGLQTLHCLKKDSVGGENQLVDGLAIAEKIRSEYPDYFEILSIF